ncbi:MAG: dienelactone hydrolase family protein [Gemmatimonadaceae bacterium]|nr:dienelactone hydrolase family protein [Gemmatimonadaceae bacterium]
MTARATIALALCGALSGACATSQQPESEHAGHSAAVAAAAPVNSLPADEAGALARLTASPRHGEWVTIRTGAQDSIRAWVVYPERKTKAPVVLVVHEIFGLTPWIRNVADQLAAEGFLAVAPDLLTMKNLPGFPDSVDRQAAAAAIRTLQSVDVQRQLSAIADYATSLPSATKRYGIVGFCWGGSVSFQHAASSPRLVASVVYYGGPPAGGVATVVAPVLGLYGGSDARINATIPSTDSAMKAAGKTYAYHIYEGAGHGFLRQQSGMTGANATATAAAWPETLAWFRKHLGK